jgi:hypothetical protein
MSGRVTVRIDHLVVGGDPRAHARAIEAALTRELTATGSRLSPHLAGSVRVSSTDASPRETARAVAQSATGRAER